MKFKRVDQIARWRLCMGCGACVYLCPNEAISLVDIVDVGIRPQVDENKCQQCHDCIKICPGIELEHKPFPEGVIDELKQAWGPVLEIWEGYAANQHIRYASSSGGVTTALALYALESGSADGVLHIGADEMNPIKNIPLYSTTKKQLLTCTGSRYAPVAPCQMFNTMKVQDGKSVFIGKPCDVAALNKARKIDPELDEKVALAISIFCAGIPTTKGTYKLLDALSVKPEEVEELRYRGHGWPGMTTVKVKGNKQTYQMTYNESWGGILSNNVQMRCRLCPDGTGEFADISCGDPWYREIKHDEPGRSLVLVRTKHGKEILQNAMDAGYINIHRVKFDTLPQSQKSLYIKRRYLFGRLLAMKVMFIPVPRFDGFRLLSNWRSLSLSERLRSILGTFHRGITRGWMLPIQSVKSDPANFQMVSQTENK